ncbi:Stress response protein nst1 [Dinochytrium kinnereticum]|nr:Stress response protein nst1 [Dinochytrium kinnereticum]
MVTDDEEEAAGHHTGSKKKAKKKKKGGSDASVVPGTNSAGGGQGKTSDSIWYKSDAEEKQRIREFWLQLGEDERRALVKLEKEAVLRKMKEQQKQTCSCSVCGRKRTVIEEELEILYDAYYEELEHFAHDQAREGGILTVADDFLKNDGRKFLDLMEQLAERKIRLLEEEDMSTGSGGGGGGNQDWDENYDDEDDEDYDDEEDSMTEEQRMEEGRRMFQIFAAKMFEQRVLTAYREKVAHERQMRLLQELEEEKHQQDLKEEAKQKVKEKKKEKKKAVKQLKEEEKLAKERERLAEEERIRAEKEKKIEEDRHRKEAEKARKEEERMKREEAERAKREAERLKKEEEKRKQREAEEKKQKAKDDKERAEREKREREAKAKEAAEKEAADRKAAAVAAAAAADAERKRKEEEKVAAQKAKVEAKASAAKQAAASATPSIVASQPVKPIQILQNPRTAMAANSLKQPSTPSNPPQSAVRPAVLHATPPGFSAAAPPGIAVARPSMPHFIPSPPQPQSNQIQPQHAVRPPLIPTSPVKSSMEQQQSAGNMHQPGSHQPIHFSGPAVGDDPQQQSHTQHHLLSTQPGNVNGAMYNKATGLPGLGGWGPVVDNNLMMRPMMPYPQLSGLQPHMGLNPTLSQQQQMMAHGMHAGVPPPAAGMGGPAAASAQTKPLLGIQQQQQQHGSQAASTAVPSSGIGASGQIHGSGLTASLAAHPGLSEAVSQTGAQNTSSLSTSAPGVPAPIGFGKPTPIGRPNANAPITVSAIGPPLSSSMGSSAPIGGGSGGLSAGPVGGNVYAGPFGSATVFGGFGPLDHQLLPYGTGAGPVGPGAGGRGADIFSAEPWRVQGVPPHAPIVNPIGPPSSLHTGKNSGLVSMVTLDRPPEVGAIGSKPTPSQPPQLSSPPMVGQQQPHPVPPTSSAGQIRSGLDHRLGGVPGPIGPPGVSHNLQSHLPPGIAPVQAGGLGSLPYQHNSYHHHHIPHNPQQPHVPLQQFHQPLQNVMQQQQQQLGVSPGPHQQQVGGQSGGQQAALNAGRLYEPLLGGIWDSPTTGDLSGHRNSGVFGGFPGMMAGNSGPQGFLPQHSMFSPASSQAPPAANSSSAGPIGQQRPPSPSLVSSKAPPVVSPTAAAGLPVSAGAGGAATGSEFGWR